MSDGVEWGSPLRHHPRRASPTGVALSAARLAEYHGVPAPYLAKHLQALTRAGVFVAVPGPRGGYRLARPAAEVTVLDIVEAVDGRQPAFRCTEIRRRGPSAVAPSEYRLPCGIHRAMVRRRGVARRAAPDDDRRPARRGGRRGAARGVGQRRVAEVKPRWLQKELR